MKKHLFFSVVLFLFCIYFFIRTDTAKEVRKELDDHHEYFSKLLKDADLTPFKSPIIFYDTLITKENRQQKQRPDLIEKVASINSKGLSEKGLHSGYINSNELQKKYPELYGLGYRHVSIYSSCLLLSDEKHMITKWLLYCNGPLELTVDGSYYGGVFVNHKYPNNWYLISFMD